MNTVNSIHNQKSHNNELITDFEYVSSNLKIPQQHVPSEKIVIFLHATDKDVQQGKSHPGAINAADCIQFTINPLIKGDNSWADYKTQLTNFANTEGGNNHLVQKIVLSGHGGVDNRGNPLAGLIEIDEKGPVDSHYNLVDLAKHTSTKIEPNGELWLMGCSLAPKGKAGDIVKAQLRTIAIEKKGL